VADIFVFSNGLSILGYFFVALVLGGVVGLNLKSDTRTPETAD
jgi:multidrug transporter EmrE-like cation transporter